MATRPRGDARDQVGDLLLSFVIRLLISSSGRIVDYLNWVYKAVIDIPGVGQEDAGAKTEDRKILIDSFCFLLRRQQETKGWDKGHQDCFKSTETSWSWIIVCLFTDLGETNRGETTNLFSCGSLECFFSWSSFLCDKIEESVCYYSSSSPPLVIDPATIKECWVIILQQLTQITDLYLTKKMLFTNIC